MQIFLYGVIKRLKDSTSNKAGLARDLNDKESEFRAFLDNNAKWDGLQELYELLCTFVLMYWERENDEKNFLLSPEVRKMIEKEKGSKELSKYTTEVISQYYLYRCDLKEACAKWGAYIVAANVINAYYQREIIDLNAFGFLDKYDKYRMNEDFINCGIIPNHNHNANNAKAEESGKGRSGRPRARFEDAIMGKYESRTKEIIEKIRTALHGRRGKAAAEVIAGAMELGYIRKPTYAEFKNEFGSLITKQDYQRLITDNPNLRATDDVKQTLLL